MQENTPVLAIEGLTKNYKISRLFGKEGSNKWVAALDDVSITLEPGLYALLGPNGAGKSTMMKIITGTLRQDKGKVLWNGDDINALGIQYRRILGYMPQQQTLYSSFTGWRFLLYLAALKEIPAAKAAEEAKRVAGAMNLTKELDKRLSAYSGGMRQRLLAAAAFLGTPKLLIMDEPTAGLDPKERVRLRNLLADISKECIVLIATHVVADIESVADNVLLLARGSLVDSGTPQQLIQRHAPGANLEAVYLAIFGEEEGA